MEYLDVVNEENDFLGKIEDRNSIHEKGLWHREVAVWVLNKKGEVLVQKRAATKKQAPNKWAVTAGHIDAGENPISAAIRESYEEIGLELKENDIEFLFITKINKKFSECQYNNHFQYCFCVKTYKKISEFKIQKEELSEIKYISIEDLEDIVNSGDENYVFSKSSYMPQLIENLKHRIYSL